MNKPSYVCTLCSQDFTRKWTGKRHNQNIHFGQSKIVRLIDYIVGRLSGQFFPANPLEYRSQGVSRKPPEFDYCCEPIELKKVLKVKGKKGLLQEEDLTDLRFISQDLTITERVVIHLELLDTIANLSRDQFTKILK